MACQAKKHSSFIAVVMILIIQAVGAATNEGIRDGHLSFLNVNVTVNVEFDPTCADHSDITDIDLTVPRGSNLLNVLEYANKQSDSISEYEVLYLHNLGYYLFSINQLKDTTDCGWVFITNPDVSRTNSNDGIKKSLDDVLVSNFGFEVTYRYVSNIGSFNKPTIDSVLQNTSGTEQTIPEDNIGPSIDVSYQIGYPNASCPSVGGVPSTINLVVSEGSSALRVLERGARMDAERSFVAKNIIGYFYSIEIIGSMNNIPSCQWCALYSPSNLVPAFLINSDVNNYIIPVSGGILTLQYRDSCNGIQNAINSGIITDELSETFGINTGSGTSIVILCPQLMILTIITSFLIKFYT